MRRSKPLRRSKGLDRTGGLTRSELGRKAELARQELKRRPYKPKRHGKIKVICSREGCGNVIERYASEIGPGSSYCSRACFSLDRARRAAVQRKAQRARADAVSAERQGAANPNYRHGKRVGAHDRAGKRRFQSGQSECVHQTCDDRSRPSHEHHVVYEQHVRKEGGDRWDPRNALRLCVSCHPSHHRRGRVLSLAALRDENYEFAFELLGPAAYDYLRRRYSGEDPRLSAWLKRAEVAVANSGD